ncbi:MAG: DUF89 domain-containing protein [Velocimicrobium sp.]
MELFFDCLPCMLKQALEAARKTTNDVQIHDKIVYETINLMTNYKKYRNSPDIAREIHRIVKEQTGIKDPYSEIKEKDLEAAKLVYPYLKDFIKSKENSLYWALKIAATGNNIDAAVYSDVDVKKCIEKELEKEFSICDIDIMEKKLQTASNILIIGDNTGETIFDKVMIESFPNITITYGVRSEAIINDVTKKDAIASGLDQVSKIVSTGCSAPGAILEDCSNEFIDIYNKSDIIISKGQGNYEALSEERGNMFFLLKAKCPMISQRLHVNLNEYIFKYGGTKQS